MHYADAVASLANLYPSCGSRFRACYRKQAYSTLPGVLAAKEKRESCTGLILHIYHCEYGGEPDGHWHLSSHEASEAQRARRVARSIDQARQTREEFARLEAQIRALTQQTEHLMQVIRQRHTQLDRARSIAILNALYVTQREDLGRLLELWNEKVDLMFARDQIVTCIRDVVSNEPPTLDSYQRFLTKLIALEDDAERIQEDNTACITESLASLDAQQAEDVRWLKEQFNKRYTLPAMSWRS